MAKKSSPKIVNILLVEDNKGDIRLTQEAIKEWKIRNNLHVVENGVEAMEFLYHNGKYAGVPIPDLILLDLSLPQKDGRQVLYEIKKNEFLKSIPVIILTASSFEEDISKSYEYQANCYITKPLDFEQLTKVIQAIENFWLTIVTLPNKKKLPI
ncbi:MAG: response regulator [Ignavibacteria bacterium]